MSINTPPLICRSHGWSGRAMGFAIGGLCVLGQAPLHIWGVSLVGFAILFARLLWVSRTDGTLKAGFHSAFWFGLGYFGVGVFWVGSAFIARGPEFIPVMPPMVLALAAILALFWGLAGAAFAKAQLKPVWAPFGFVALFMLAELSRGNAFGGLPWNLPAYIFPAGSLPSQSAYILTSYGLSLFVFSLSAALAMAVLSKHKIIALVISGLLLVGLYGFGAYRLKAAEVTLHPDITLRIVSVPFDQADKFDPEKSTDIVNQFITQSVADSPRPTTMSSSSGGPLAEVTHIIWPEGAVSGLAMDNEYLLYIMGAELASRLTGDLPVWLFNSLRSEQRPNPKGGSPIDDYYNSSVAVTFDGNGVAAIAGYNDKARLVPFGEFIPFGKWMESMNVPVISTSLLSISPAKKKTLARFPGLPLGSPQLCYEVVFPGLTPEDAEGQSPQFILNQSNDAWFGKSWGPAQHANIARYRAIEEGLPLVRAASNGQSAVSDPYGRVFAEVKADRPAHIDSALPRALETPAWKESIKTKQMIFYLSLIIVAISLLSATFGRASRHANI